MGLGSAPDPSPCPVPALGGIIISVLVTFLQGHVHHSSCQPGEATDGSTVPILQMNTRGPERPKSCWKSHSGPMVANTFLVHTEYLLSTE